MQDALDFIKNNAQLIAPVATSISAIIAAVALLLNRKSLRAQTLANIQNAARTIHFSRGMDAIRELPSKSFDDFLKLDEQKKTDIREVIDFLNDLRHLTRHRYITRKHVFDMYEVSIEACVIRLHPDWVEGFRIENAPVGSLGRNYYYQSFYNWCEEVRKKRQIPIEIKK